MFPLHYWFLDLPSPDQLVRMTSTTVTASSHVWQALFPLSGP